MCYKELVSNLRHEHHLNTMVTQLGICDYIVSVRMGIERKSLSGKYCMLLITL